VATNDSHYELFCPGAFETFFSGTGVVAGEPFSDDPVEQAAAEQVRQAYRESTSFKRGKGYLFGLRLESVEAVAIVASYADWCIHSNYGGEVEHTEVRAARKVLERAEKITGGRVKHDGFSVLLDGKRVS